MKGAKLPQGPSVTNKATQLYFPTNTSFSWHCSCFNYHSLTWKEIIFWFPENKRPQTNSSEAKGCDEASCESLAGKVFQKNFFLGQNAIALDCWRKPVIVVNAWFMKEGWVAVPALNSSLLSSFLYCLVLISWNMDVALPSSLLYCYNSHLYVRVILIGKPDFVYIVMWFLIKTYNPILFD